MKRDIYKMTTMPTKEELETALDEDGMDRQYHVNMREDKTDWGHTFSSKEIMKLCNDMSITRYVTVLAKQSKYFNKDCRVINTEYWGAWYQVRLPEPHVAAHSQRKYTFPNLKIKISNQTLEEFRVACRTWDKPQDYIKREFKKNDIIFLRQFYRVHKVFGGFMLVRPLDTSIGSLYQKVMQGEASRYLIIEDPIVHLAL